MSKKWYRSKTIITNAIALVAMILQAHYGVAISPQTQVEILAIINLGLRAYTSDGIES